MSDIRDVNAIHQAANTDLARRRELSKLTRVELIDYIVNFQNAVEPLIASIDAAYGDQP